MNESGKPCRKSCKLCRKVLQGTCRCSSCHHSSMSIECSSTLQPPMLAQCHQLQQCGCILCSLPQRLCCRSLAGSHPSVVWHYVGLHTTSCNSVNNCAAPHCGMCFGLPVLHGMMAWCTSADRRAAMISALDSTRSLQHHSRSHH
jgi:hypothetical protein